MGFLTPKKKKKKSLLHLNYFMVKLILNIVHGFPKMYYLYYSINKLWKMNEVLRVHHI